MRSNYWSCSKYADWLRGTPKISSGTIEEWNTWEKTARKRRIRYWLAENGLDSLQNFVNWPTNRLHELFYYVGNRWISKTHALTSNLNRGQWQDFDARLLHSAFDELVNFVEVEQAWLQVVFSEKEERKKFKAPLCRRLFRAWLWRSQEAGLAYLEWAAGLKHDENWIDKEDPCFGQPTHQAKGAQETLVLYKWWKEQRPKRPDPMDASGLRRYYEKKRKLAEASGDTFLIGFDTNESEEDREYYRETLDLCQKMEQEQEEDDTEMLIRLVKLRKELWS